MGKRRQSDTYLLDRAGTVLGGRYRVVSLLGTGGMGSVWVAEQMALKHTVVVKFHESWYRELSGNIELERFVREARLLASVKHRNVTELFEVGETDEGEPYLIMEHLTGCSLAQRMRDGERFAVDEAVEIAIGLASGLDAVHEAGIYHRDVKPENIFLHQSAEEGLVIPKLLDFGLAASAKGSSLTSPNQTVGTPGYMAPELAYGVKDTDHRVDLYALAVTLYEMLAADLPFRGRSAQALMIAVTRTDPIPLTAHRPELVGPLTDVVMRALAPHRDDRYPDAKRFRQALAEAFEEMESMRVADTI